MNNNRGSESSKLLTRIDWQYISVLLGIGFLTRMIFFSQTYLISIDGAYQYIPVAKLFAWGECREALHQPQLPLYPFLMSVVSKVTGNFEISGQIISLTASILAVIPLYLLGKSILEETAAFWAGIFYFLNPEMLQRSADVLQEGLLIFLLFSAVFLFYLFLNERRIFWLVASTFVTLLAVLTRVVSLMFIPVFIFWILFIKKKLNVGLPKRLGYILIILALCAAVVVPLMINVKGVTGHWDISKKTVTVRSLIESVLFDKAVEMGEAERGPFTLVRKIIKVYHPILFLFLLAGLIRRKAVPRNFFKEMFLFSFIFGYLIIIGMMMWSTQRYLFFPILLSYLWAGVGAVEIQGKVTKRLPLSEQRVTISLLALILIIFLPVLINPYRVEKLGRKAVGHWIKYQEIGKPVILTDAHLVMVAYYAEGEFLTMDKSNYENNILEARAKGIKYIVVEEKNIEKNYPHFIELARKDFILQRGPEFSAKKRERYLVFKSRY